MDRTRVGLKWILAAATLTIALWRVLLWQLMEPLTNVAIERAAKYLALPRPLGPMDIPGLAIILSYAVIIVSGLLLVARDGPLRNRRFLVLSIPLILYVFLAGISQYWSVLPATSAKRFWFLLAVTLGGLLIGTKFRLKEILVLFEAVSVVLIIGSYAVLIRYPHYAIDYEYEFGAAWRGILKYKGYAGSMMAFAGTVFLVQASRWREHGWARRIYSVSFLGLALVMVVRARSATAQIAFLGAVAAFVLGLAWVRWRHKLASKHYRAIAASGLVLFAVLLMTTQSVFGVFGKDMTLTGRVPLWREVISKVQARPVWGWGFGEAYWLSSDVEELWQTVGWTPGTAHSGFVEVLLDTGVSGFVAIGALVGLTLILVRGYVRDHPDPLSLALPTWLAVALLVNVGENLLGTYELFFWLVLVAVFSHAATATVPSALAPHSRLKPMKVKEDAPTFK